MFTKERVVRLSEVGQDGHLTLPGVINYFQDCSELHSESVGVGVEIDNDYAWVLNSWQIQIKSYPKMNDKITVGTLPHRIKGIQGDRNFLMMDENDNVIINANSIWSYFDFINNRPIRVTKDQIEAYKLEPAYPMEYAERRIKIKDIPEDLYETKAEITVTESMIDVIGHMNNMQYVLVSNDYLPEGYSYNQVRVEYLMPALKWDKIVVKQYRDDERLICLLVSPDGDKYAIIEYTNVNIK